MANRMVIWLKIEMLRRVGLVRKRISTWGNGIQ